MNRSKLKTYAPQARRDFIQAVTDRAAVYGLTPGKIEPITERGDVAIIGGKPFPIGVAEKRRRLEERVQRHGFEQVMEAMAYTWFNRLVAIRYMEIHGYLDHGYRVLSNADTKKSSPEIVENAERVDLPGLDTKKVVDLKLDGTKEAELYRMLLLAQCNAMNKAMPFLFERIDDETELLLPDNLLHSDSIIRKLVNEIEEADWQQVEIIGWLYQFYISEKKNEVIGSVVKSEDIPAATQLFTPNWIVKYLVQNSLGRQWLATYPQSALKAKMEFYIEPAEQTPEVQAELKKITPESLNPEELTLMDPACGSGHILVEAYDLLKEIYLERGYRLRDIPKLILSKNLFGLEIDDRAAQLAAFALMMKARADDRRIFDGDAQPAVLAIQESNGLNVNAIVQAFTEKKITSDGDLVAGEFGFMGAVRAPLFATENQASATVDDKLASDVKSLCALFENAKTYGSLIQIPPKLAARLLDIERRFDKVLKQRDLTHAPIHLLKPFLQQTRLLARRYGAVVANPPYMGSNGQLPHLKAFAKSLYPAAKHDLFAMFMQRCPSMTATAGFMGFVTPFVWMFISSFRIFRESLFDTSTIASLVQLEYNAFEPACVPVCAFVLVNISIAEFAGDFIRLSDFKGHQYQALRTQEAIKNPSCGWRYRSRTKEMRQIPGSPIAYWSSEKVRKSFANAIPLKDISDLRQGLATTDNARFVRFWWEVDIQAIRFGCTSKLEAAASKAKWFPYNKGGDYRKWYGNIETVVNWQNDGEEIKANIIRKYVYLDGNPDFVAKNQEYYFRPGITWSRISSCNFGVRLLDKGFVFDANGSGIFPPLEYSAFLLAFLCSCLAIEFLKMLSPTLSFQAGDVGALPIHKNAAAYSTILLRSNVNDAVSIARQDWNSLETAWDYGCSPLLRREMVTEEAFAEWQNECNQRVSHLQAIEARNNRLILELYGLQDEISPEVPDNQITLYRADRGKDIERLLSYALGCAMGRYSLDKPGLIYANSGNEGFDPSQYKTFPADKDGIIPLTEIDWFTDAVANRFEEFVGVAWPKEHLEENLKFVADSLGPKNGEQPRDTIRRYFANDFYKHHLQTYKRRPIYWLFTSGKFGAFQCLVYLHRYNEGTLARMRTEYVIPLIGKIKARIEQLKGDMEAAQSASLKKKLKKEHDTLIQHLSELTPMDRTIVDDTKKRVGPTFDEKLRHYADMRIKLDLDDGVKVNFGKFGDLLACVTQVCGKGEDED